MSDTEWAAGVAEGVNRALLVLETISAMDPACVSPAALDRVREVYQQIPWAERDMADAEPPPPRSGRAKDVADWIEGHHRARETVYDLLAADKKINAIKELRNMTLLGLKEAKEGVEEYQRRRIREGKLIPGGAGWGSGTL